MKNRISFSSRGQSAVELTVFGFLIVIAFSVLAMYGQQLDLQQQVRMEAFRRAVKKAYDLNSSASYSIKKDARFIDIMGGFGREQPSTVGASASVMWQKGIPGAFKTDGKDASHAFYAINDQELGDPATGLPTYKKHVVGYDGSESEVYVPESVWNEESVRVEELSTTVGKYEHVPGIINNTRSASLSDTITTKVYTRQDTAVPDDAQDNPAPIYVYNTTPLATITQQAVLVTDRTTTVDDGETKYSNMTVGDTDTNRIAYKTGAGTTINRSRSWNTDIQN